MKYTIDAENKKIGRVASEAAVILMGKNLTTFTKNKVVDNKVVITNASKASVDSKKKDDKVYVTYTGYRGGLKSEKLGELIARSGIEEVLKRAVYRMLPDNKLRNDRIKNLTINA